MRRFVIASVAMVLAAPVLADPPADAPPKMKKVCHPGASSNPLFPTMKCHMVAIEETAPAAPPAAAAAAATPSEMAMQNASTPH